MRHISRFLAAFGIVAILVVVGMTQWFRASVRSEVQRSLDAPDPAREAMEARETQILVEGVDPDSGERFLPIDQARRLLVDQPGHLQGLPATADGPSKQPAKPTGSPVEAGSQ